MGKWEKLWVLRFAGNEAEAALVTKRWGKVKFTRLAEANAVRDAVMVIFPDVEVQRLSIAPTTVTALD